MKPESHNIPVDPNVQAQAACPPGTIATQTSVCGCPCTCCCPNPCCTCIRYTYKCGKNLSKCPKIPCANALLTKENKVNSKSFVEKAGRYGQIINNQVNYNEIWNASEKSINQFPEFSFEPIYSQDGKFSFGEPEWDEDGNLYAGVNMAAGSVPCPTDCAIITIVFCAEGGCLTCPKNGRMQASCDMMLTAEVTSNPFNKNVNININNSGEVAFIKKGSYVKIDVSISDKKSIDEIYLDNKKILGFPDDCPCSLACCECVANINLNSKAELIKNKILYRTKNLQTNSNKAFFNKEHLTKMASQRLNKIKKS